MCSPANPNTTSPNFDYVECRIDEVRREIIELSNLMKFITLSPESHNKMLQLKAAYMTLRRKYIQLKLENAVQRMTK